MMRSASVFGFRVRNGLPGRAGEPAREGRIISMVNTHVTVTSTRLDNSHDVSEESVTRNLDNAPNATQVPDEPAPQDQHLPETLLSFPASSDPPASLSAKRPSMTIHLCHHRIRRPFRPVCFSCSSTTTQPCWQQTPQN